MIQIILTVFVLLWLVGFIQVPILNATLFSIAKHPFSLQSLLYLVIILWAVSLLPGIFRTIMIVLLVLWLLTNIGFFTGFSNIILLLLILVIVFSFI